MKLYIFDFDGTITSLDSFLLFSYHSVSTTSFLKFYITSLPLFFFLPKRKIKEKFFMSFVNTKLNYFNHICDAFSNNHLSKFIKKSFIDYIAILDPQSKVVIVSASISNYLEPWCKKMEFDLISTELEVKNGKLTGRFSTPNCNGIEKVIRIQEKYNLSDYDEIHVFGNTKGDLPMLELGTHKYFKFFK